MYLKSYTTDNGLPSNRTYNCVQDKNGALWISTDNGVSRFDGYNFYNYGPKNGLMGKDIVRVEKDDKNVIWANEVSAGISFFNEESNSFVAPVNDKFKIENQAGYSNRIYALPNQKLAYSIDGKLFVLNKPFLNETPYYNKLTGLISSINAIPEPTLAKDKIIILKNNKEIYNINNKEILNIFYKHLESFHYLFDDSVVYIHNKYYLMKFTNTNSKEKFNYNFIKLNASVKCASIQLKHIILTLFTGEVLIIDKVSLKIIQKINTQAIANVALEDTLNNLWVTTSNSGIMLYNQPTLQKINNKKINDLKFISAANCANNLKVFGTEDGKIIELKKDLQVYNFSKEKKRALSILPFGKKYLVLTDNGFVNFNNNTTVAIPGMRTKGFTLTNNNELLFIGYGGATAKSRYNALIYNLITKKYFNTNITNDNAHDKVINTSNKIIISGGAGMQYLTQINGKNKISIVANFTQKIQQINIAKDSLIWTSDVNNNIAIFKHKDSIKKIKDFIINEDILCFYSDKPGTMLIGGRSSLYILNYKQIADTLQIINTTVFNTSDGLAGSAILSLTSDSSKYYLGTEHGIYFLDKLLKKNNAPINLQLAQILIDNKAYNLQQQYTLPQGRKTIEIILQTISLNKNLRLIEYAINDTTSWQMLNHNKLNLIFNEGVYTVYLRGVSLDGIKTANTLKINFDIYHPFYKTIFFWTIISFLTALAIFYFFYKNKINKQKKISAQLAVITNEKLKMSADLHDDIGASLSSLQLNSALALKVIDTNNEKAKMLMQKIENQAQNLSSRVSDFIWSMKPGKEEFLPFSSRVKTFAMELLESTPINYTITIDTLVDKNLLDFELRKSLINISKELINNGAKYSKASQMELTITFLNNQFNLHYWDNGIGFDASKIKYGNGLNNLYRRTEQLNGNINIETEIGKGMQVVITIPVP